MFSLEDLKFTKKGLELESLAQLGKTLKFTRFKIGDGTISSESEIQNLLDLKNPKMTLNINESNIKAADNPLYKIVTLGFRIDKTDLTESFYFREVGIYAEDPDDSTKEILVLYGNVGDKADYLNKDAIFSCNFYYDITVSNNANITVEVDISAGVSQEYVDNKIRELENKLQDPIIVSETEPEQDCIWYKVLRSKRIDPDEDDTVLVQTTELDGTEIYIAETDNKEEKVINVDEELENNGNIVFEEI